MGELRESLMRGERKDIVLLEGSQASPLRPSDKNKSETEDGRKQRNSD
jgi:hypothetical protein